MTLVVVVLFFDFLGSGRGLFRRSRSQCLDPHEPSCKPRTSGKDVYHSQLSSDSPRGQGSFSPEPGVHLYPLGSDLWNVRQSTNDEEGLWSRICFDTETPLTHDCRHLILRSGLLHLMLPGRAFLFLRFILFGSVIVGQNSLPNRVANSNKVLLVG